MKNIPLLLAGLMLILGACAPGPEPVTLTVYFTNINRYAIGTEPYEDPVTRTLPVTVPCPRQY
jgi:hypothetical protein